MNKKIVYGAVALGVGYLIYKAMQKKQGIGEDPYLLTAPSGRTRTINDPASGFGEDPYLLTAPDGRTLTVADEGSGLGVDKFMPTLAPAPAAVSTNTTVTKLQDYKGHSIWSESGSTNVLVDYNATDHSASAEAASNGDAMIIIDLMIDPTYYDVKKLKDYPQNFSVWQQVVNKGGTESVVYYVNFDPATTTARGSFTSMADAEAAINSQMPAVETPVQVFKAPPAPKPVRVIGGSPAAPMSVRILHGLGSFRAGTKQYPVFNQPRWQPPRPAVQRYVSRGSVVTPLARMPQYYAGGNASVMPGYALRGLGEDFDAYDAKPSQYRRTVVNDLDMNGLGDLGRGWGSKISHAVSHAVSSVSHAVTQVAKVVNKAVIKPIGKAAEAVGKATTRVVNVVIVNPVKIGASAIGLGPKKSGGGGDSYTDENGNPITKAQYDQLMADAAKYTPTKAEDYGGHSVWAQVQKEGGTKFMVDYNATDNTCISLNDTKAAAEAYIDSLNPAQYAPVKATDYNGHTIWTMKQQSGGVVYLVDFDATANTATDQETTMELAKAFIDSQKQGTATTVNDQAPTTARIPDPTSPTTGVTTAAAGVVSFAKAYNGHAILTLTQAGGGVVYLVDVAQGGTTSGGGFAASYPTMVAAQAAIDAANPPIPTQAPAAQYQAPAAVDTSAQQYAPAPAAQYQAPAASYQAPAQTAAPAKTGGGVATAAAVAGAGILAFFAMK